MRLFIATIMLIAEVVFWMNMRVWFGPLVVRVFMGCVYFILVLSLDALVAIPREQKMRFLNALASYSKSPVYWHVVMAMFMGALILKMILWVMNFFK